VGTWKQQKIRDVHNSTAAPPETIPTEPLREALSPASLRLRPLDDKASARNNIIIGFVGGFVKHDESKHPEVQFATLLRAIYGPNVHVEVFANHDGKKAFRRVLQLLDSNGDGVIAAKEKKEASIIIYGHSWGGSQTVALAQALGLRGVPIALTIQIDSVRKPHQEDSVIPPNVKNAVNFYQTDGLIHGRSAILAAAPEQTRIVGNFRMDYQNRRINCANYPWLARHFNKPHHKIENDPNVWDKIASLIDVELRMLAPMVESSGLSESIH